MGIAVPDEIDYLDFGMLYIGGQSNDDAVMSVASSSLSSSSLSA